MNRKETSKYILTFFHRHKSKTTGKRFLPRLMSDIFNRESDCERVVFLVHYDNATHEPEFFIFSTFDGARRKVEDLMDDWEDENGNPAWQQIVHGEHGRWQWSDDHEHISITAEKVYI